MTPSWTRPLPLHELARGPVKVTLSPDEAQRAALATSLGLESLPALTAKLTIRPWLDGAEVEGRFTGRVEQICSVSAEPFEQPLEGEFSVRVLPAGSPNAGAVEDDAVDPEAPDPPDVLDGDAINLAAVVGEHMALEIDPFPRAPGAAFEFDAGPDETSPFAALKTLKTPKP
jgi:uncharacterized metal-binding protein YceD (DUF177 family)